MRPKRTRCLLLLRIAESDLALARAGRKAQDPAIRAEELCFHCAAAVEESLRAVCLALGFDAPDEPGLADLWDFAQAHLSAKSELPRVNVGEILWLNAYASKARNDVGLPEGNYEVADSAIAQAELVVSVLAQFCKETLSANLNEN